MTHLTTTVRVLLSVVPSSDCHRLVRVLWEDFCERGVSPAELQAWRESACPFPHLRDHPLVGSMAQRVRDAVGATGQMCEPQFIWHLPQSDAYTEPPSHIDEEPAWAEGRHYEMIAGVALTPWSASNGTLRYWHGLDHLSDLGYWAVQLQLGDVVVMPPGLPHAAGVNHGTEIRAGLYFRWLEPKEE